MITGRVNERHEAIIPVQMRGSTRHFEVVIDTGFQGSHLMLPRIVIRTLGLTRRGTVRSRLANEQVVRIASYSGEVVWHNGFKRVRVLESENSYLASADLLAGSHVEIDMIPGGIVRIEALTAHGEPVEP